jgi:hypothetical protein
MGGDPKLEELREWAQERVDAFARQLGETPTVISAYAVRITAKKNAYENVVAHIDEVNDVS